MDQGGKGKEDGTLHIFKKGSPLLLHASTFAHNLHTSCNTRIPVSSFGLGREPANISSTTRRFPLLSSPSSAAVARGILMRGKRRIKRVGGRRGKTGDQYFKKWKRVRNSAIIHRKKFSPYFINRILIPIPFKSVANVFLATFSSLSSKAVTFLSFLPSRR